VGEYGGYFLEALRETLTTWDDNYIWLGITVAIAVIDSDWLCLVIFLYLIWEM
jgi:hypothetical protein